MSLSKPALTRAALLVVGVSLTYVIGWTPNWIVAAWLAPVLLLLWAREVRARWILLVMLPALSVAGFFTVRGAWHMGIGLEAAFGMVIALPLTLSVLADRLARPKLSPLLGSLVFPATWALVDYLYSFTYGIGDVFSPALTQFHSGALIQLASITGIYGITFLIGWTASVVATAIAHRDDLDAWRRPAQAVGLALALVMTYGSVRLSAFDRDADTVRIASIVVPHQRDYWEAIIDRGVPATEAGQFVDELQALEDQLFAQTRRAAAADAKIIFWFEAAAVYYEDHAATFDARAEAVAIELGVYLQTSSLVMRYDDTMIDNQVTLYTPEGEVAYRYLKTQTWYPTESDGVIPYVDTPYGRVSSVICFDLDFPTWMQQVARNDVDILLVPGFDTLAIAPYHTEEGLIRAIEGGYQIVRGVGAGTSMSVDSRGRVLSLSDTGRTAEPVLYSETPTAGERTVYGTIGDVFAWLNILGWLTLVALAWRRRSEATR